MDGDLDLLLKADPLGREVQDAHLPENRIACVLLNSET